VDVPASPQELVRPWRTATIVASTVAAIELVLLLAAGVLLVAKPLSRTIRHHAEATALAPTKQATKAPAARRTTAAAPAPRLTRARTSVIVLNGNGRSGAAAQGAAKLHAFGYVIAGTGNARRQDYAATVVMYKPGFRAEGLRLARDLKAKVVGPLDGLKPSALMGGQLAVVLGA
jgi:LytR cell envelope-related transcriptional attenuator